MSDKLKIMQEPNTVTVTLFTDASGPRDWHSCSTTLRQFCQARGFVAINGKVFMTEFEYDELSNQCWDFHYHQDNS